MNKYLFSAVFLLSTILTAGCQSSHSVDNSDLEKYEVSQISDETVQGDFIFRIKSEKGEYEEGEDIELYGEIEYIGEKDEVKIHHSSSAILFPMREKIRGYEIGSAVNDIGLSTTLKKGVPYREEYGKSGGYSEDQDPQDYVNFMKEFLNGTGFPAGYYVVQSSTDFSVESGEHVRVKGTVDFKVMKK
ncbi:hypothetical protein [Bacillus infantis]|uniref:DUF3221 domain-containing protein n=1 Tax=Bacillus infantis TaxID=324767 RepID=A0A5D4R891_9BACI|nr:hypothetical protein [Bacillus infantis]TYS47663.1 hypothetical protein FZD51_12020 [Bacillus infantis]